MARELVRIRGARTHNLKDVSVDLVRGAWTVVVGVSGSGKSSLVMDTLVAESRRRYLGTLRHAVPGVDLAPRPPVDSIAGLPPAVATGFSPVRPGRRATLGTITEVTRALRTLVARLGVVHCPMCDRALSVTTTTRLTEALLAHPEGTRLVLVAPSMERGAAALEAARAAGFVRVRRADGRIVRIEEVDDLRPEEALGTVVDRLVVRADARERFAASVDTAFAMGGGRLAVLVPATGDGAPAEEEHALQPWCAACQRAWPLPSPASLSFDHPGGACATCAGRGEVDVVDAASALPAHLPLARLATHLAGGAAAGHAAAVRRRVKAWRQALGRRGTVRLGDLEPDDLAALWRGALGPGGPALGEVLHGPRAGPRLGRATRCTDCAGTRLAPLARSMRWAGSTLAQLEDRPLTDLAPWLAAVDLPGALGALLAPVREDAVARLAFLTDVGLGYLTLGRAARTLSGGELRRAELAATCAARMSGLLFALDEPTAGLHPEERELLATRLRAIVDDGNTLVTVDHDAVLFAHADEVVVIGPGAGRDGGRVLLAGPIGAPGGDADARALLPTAGAPLVPHTGPAADATWLRLGGAHARTLQHIDVAFPRAALSVVAGRSGAGKSTLALDVLAPAVERAREGHGLAGLDVDAVEGAEGLARVVVGAGRPGRHARALAGTLLGLLGPLRALFARTLEARARGWGPAWFGTHAPGGRCETCKGTGWRTLVLPEAAPVQLPCDVCEGRRYRREVAAVRWRGLSMADVLERPFSEAAPMFRDVPRLGAPLAAAVGIGLGYVRVGEPLTQLSAGEALRLRLAAALGRAASTATLFVLDEPCLGLHPRDVGALLLAFGRLTDAGHTVVVVEHHLDVLAAAAHVVELGPGPGADGGRVVFQGPPADLARAPTATGRRLRARTGV